MDSPLRPGTKLGRYEIRSPLGAGGMGEVFKAWDTELDRVVAIKILSLEYASDQQKLRRFVQEAKAASALNHPHILTIYEIGTGDTPFIASEFIEGDTLRQRITTGMKLTEILEIAVQAASALSAAHSAGIVHRDIKPENIMVRRDGYIKLLDFGLAKLTEAPANDADAPTRVLVNTREGVVMGTARYMSPEQAEGIAVDARSDIWSLGVVIYEMLTGQPPFAARTAPETLSLILQRQPAPLTQLRENIPAELERIVSKALTKDREERYQTTKDLLIDLRNLKRKLDAESDTDHSLSPNSPKETVTTQGRSSALASGGESRPLSSAEYIVTGIKEHKLATAIVLTVLILGGVSLFLYQHARTTEAAIESIAVLPFQNRSTEPDTDYLADGLAESLIYRLSQLPNLKVSPTSSVFRYKGKEIDPIKAGHELDVNAVLSGRIIQRGDSMTVSAELVDVRYNKLLWGEQYDRKTSELLQTQREIAREIVEKLQLRVSGQEKGLTKHYTESNDAYQLYMKGRYYWNKRNADGLHKSVEYFQQAIEKDPNFALAYSGLADSYSLLGGPEAGGDTPPNETLPKAKAAALKAVELDDSLAEPHVSLGHVTYFYDRDWAAAEREFQKAIELNPNYATAHHWYAIYLSMNPARESQALSEIRRAQQLDPLSLAINSWLGRILALSGRLDEAIDTLRKAIELDPNFILMRVRLANIYLDKGMYDDALSEFTKVEGLPFGRIQGVSGLALTYAMAGKQTEAQKRLDELLQISKQQYVAPGQIAAVYIALGDKDKAFSYLDEAVKEHDLNAARLKVDPRFTPLRSDPRYDDLVKRVGIP